MCKAPRSARNTIIIQYLLPTLLLAILTGFLHSGHFRGTLSLPANSVTLLHLPSFLQKCDANFCPPLKCFFFDFSVSFFLNSSGHFNVEEMINVPRQSATINHCLPVFTLG